MVEELLSLQAVPEVLGGHDVFVQINPIEHLMKDFGIVVAFHPLAFCVVEVVPRTTRTVSR